MKPGYSEKPDQKQEKECISGMKPCQLIQPDRQCGPRKKHSQSPTAEEPAGKSAVRLHPLTAADETKESLFPFIRQGKFHKACGP